MDEGQRGRASGTLARDAGAGEVRLRRMLRARRFDETLIEHAPSISGVFHVCIGQEGTAAAVAAARGVDDQLTLTHRNHHHLAALGADLAVMFAEILGRDHGPQRGRAGTLHLADAALGVPYTSAMVGGGVPIALGLAFARARRGEPGIAIACFGDGAMGEGVLHECLNLAQLWQLPVLFLCEGNSPPGAGRANAFQAAASLGALAAAHGVEAQSVDARGPEDVERALGELVARVRAGGGPAFLEALSEPWPGNRTFLPTLTTGRLDLARAAGEASGEWERSDPILVEARAQLAAGVPFEALLALDGEVRREVAEALTVALASELAPPAAAFEDVWG
ncbi:MAG TPA: thiamine pyrophosphate-dependent enzyme [Solirubrobacteraceae bacterium]|nr:thiamine pyrophosphate-dependent enzyme [Solirubrobacteraceae bacterium]